jgi:nucleotide-binding universal stress UspA family protein
MILKNLLVHMDSTAAAHARLALAITMARRSGARVTGLFAEVDSLGSSLVGKRSPQHLQQAAAKAEEAFAEEIRAAGVESEWWALESGGHSAILDDVTASCRYADLAMFGQHDPESSRIPADLVDHVVLGCGRPVLVVPAAGRHLDVGRRVVVGWNASREAARALNDAIPLMQGAEFVGILAFHQEEPPPNRLARTPRIVTHLALHGIQARYELVVREKEGIGAAEALMNYAFESQADLTVVGLPDHGFPLPHAGGGVRDFLRSMAAPVLFAH